MDLKEQHILITGGNGMLATDLKKNWKRKIVRLLLLI